MELTGRLSRQARRLASLEARLVKAELMHGARRVAVYLAMLAVAAVLGLVVLGTAVAAVVLALDQVMPAWAAALVVCVAAALVAGPLAIIGALGLKRAPQATAERVEEDVRWTTPR